MNAAGFSLFDTPIGACGAAWNDVGRLVAVQLPEQTEASTRARLRRRVAEAPEIIPPEAVRRVLERIIALLHGEAVDFSDVPLALENVPEFHRRVYASARAIPAGRTSTYGAIALALGDASAAQAVGQALGRNPLPIIVPCHRVLAAGGKLGGFSAHGGLAIKRRLLAIENARTGDQPTLFDTGVARS